MKTIRKSPLFMSMLLTSSVASLPPVQQALADFDPVAKPIPELTRMSRSSSVSYVGTYVSEPFQVRYLDDNGRRVIKKAVFGMSIFPGQNSMLQGDVCESAEDVIQYELRDAKTHKILKVLERSSFEYDAGRHLGYALFSGTIVDCRAGNIKMKYAQDFSEIRLIFEYSDTSLDGYGDVQFLDAPPGDGAIFKRM